MRREVAGTPAVGGAVDEVTVADATAVWARAVYRSPAAAWAMGVSAAARTSDVEDEAGFCTSRRCGFSVPWLTRPMPIRPT